MRGLQCNDDPTADAGKRLNWALGSDMVRAIHSGDEDRFLKWCNESPVFSCMVHCHAFQLSEPTLIPGTMTRGALAKCLVNVETDMDGGRRAFLWTLQQQRQPPERWLIYQVLAVDKAFEMTL